MQLYFYIIFYYYILLILYSKGDLAVFIVGSI